MDRLLARIHEPSGEPVTTVLEAQVLPRGSTAAPRLN
jgi:LacI family transcriptional regulator